MTHKSAVLFQSSVIEKKRNNSETSSLPRIQKVHAILAIILFVIITVYPFITLLTTSSFVAESFQNIKLLGMFIFPE